MNIVFTSMTERELISEPSIYLGPFPRFDKPKVIGFIGLENLKFARKIYEDNVSFDLNLHYDNATHKPDDRDVKLTELLEFLLKYKTLLNLPVEKELQKSYFFCYRGLLTCIATTPYENREPWKIVAIMFKGNIYLCARDTDQKILSKKNISSRERLCTSWGYKFEQYILSDAPDMEPNSDLPCDETAEFSLVFQTKLKHHSIVYGAEMDGIQCDKNEVTNPKIIKEQNPEQIISYLSQQAFIELKTSRHIEYANQKRNFRRFKLKKWWCQSFLVGIESILCGFRNDNGIVEELKLFQVKDLPKMSQKFWNPNVCFNFLDNFLTYVKRCLARHIMRKHGEQALKNLQELPMITMLFEWSPGNPVTVNENYDYSNDPILPMWFLENYGQGSE